jgi:hypothetical protein
MCTVLLSPGVNPIVGKYIIYYVFEENFNHVTGFFILIFSLFVISAVSPLPFSQKSLQVFFKRSFLSPYRNALHFENIILNLFTPSMGYRLQAIY